MYRLDRIRNTEPALGDQHPELDWSNGITHPSHADRHAIAPTIVPPNQPSAAFYSDRDRALTIPPPADHEATGLIRAGSVHPGNGAHPGSVHAGNGAHPGSANTGNGAHPSSVHPGNGARPANGSAAQDQELQDETSGDEERTLVRIADRRSAEPPPPYTELPRPVRNQEWYVRLKLRQDYVAKLWVRNLTPRDVLVWWSKRQCWAPLLTVPELRQAIVSVADSPRPDGNRASLPDIPKARSKPREMVPPSNRPPPSSGQGVLFRPTGTVARRLGSSLPPAAASAQTPEIPRAPRTPSFGPPNQSHPAYLSSAAHSYSVRSSYPPSSLVPAAAPSMLPPPGVGDRAGLSNAERAVWMFAGVAVMIAAVAALRAGTREENLAATNPVVPLVAAAQVASAVPSDVPARTQAASSTAAPAPAPAPATAARPSDRTEPQTATVSGPGEQNAATRSGKTAAVRSGQIVSATDLPLAGAQDGEGRGEAQRSDKSAATATTHVVVAPDGFDTSAARRALASAAARARQCAGSGAKGTVIVTFAPSGLVQSASLAQISGEDVREACVMRAFQLAQITPYVGQAVTVRKSFRVP